MKYYQEVTLLPGVEIPLYFIWSNVYRQLHLAFVEAKNDTNTIPYGVSFPQYQNEMKDKGLGEKVRIFARSEDELEKLGVKRWLQRLTDYVHITGIREVPDKIAGYAVYRRVHQENGAEQKTKRFLLRHNDVTVTYEDIVHKFAVHQKNKLKHLPYISQKSLTNNNAFRLYIEKQNCEQAVGGDFGTYGLSESATVPEF